MSNLNNNIKSFKFDTYSGADMRITFTVNGKTINVGNVAQIAGVIQTEGVPRYVLGRADPKAFSQGKRIISGQITLEMLNQSLMQDLKDLGVITATSTLGENATSSGTAITANATEIRYEDEIPRFDITITATKGSKTSKRVIQGVQIMSKGSTVGMQSLDVQETYQFLAADISPFELVTASEEVQIDSTKYTLS